MLNLQAAKKDSSGVTTLTGSHMGSIAFSLGGYIGCDEDSDEVSTEEDPSLDIKGLDWQESEHNVAQSPDSLTPTDETVGDVIEVATASAV